MKCLRGLRYAAVIITTLVAMSDASCGPTRLGTVLEVTYDQDDPRFVSVMTTGGDVYRMRAANASGCKGNATLWRSGFGTLFCEERS